MKGGHALPDIALAELMGCHLIGKDERYRKNSTQIHPVERSLCVQRDEARGVSCIDLGGVEIHSIYRISLEA